MDNVETKLSSGSMESEFSPEKIKQFDELIRMYRDLDNSGDSQTNLNQRIAAAGEELAHYLMRYNPGGENYSLFILNMIYLSASESNTAQVAAILDRADDLAANIILDTLQRVGTVEAYPAIRQWALAQLASINTTEDLVEADVAVATSIKALYVIQLRSKDSETLRLYQKISRQIVGLYNEAVNRTGANPEFTNMIDNIVNAGDMRSYELNAAPKEIAMQYQRELGYESYQPDEHGLPDRVSVVDGLHALVNEKAPYFMPKLELLENNPSPYAVTLGIEVEIHDEATAALDEGLNPTEVAKNKAERFHLYRLTEHLGVPSGYDGVWEFANAPVHNPKVLGREVQALMDMGLIGRGHEQYPLHLTIGGITSVQSEDAFVLARALEATGWATGSKRLLPVDETGTYTWSNKGSAGVSERDKEKMALDQKLGIEIRTLELRGLAGLHRTLSAAYSLGAALKAAQEEDRRQPIANGQASEDRQDLAHIWREFSERISAVFKKYDLPEPDRGWVGSRPNIEGDFGRLAELLDGAVAKQPEGLAFRSEVRQAVTDLRVDVAPYLKPVLPAEEAA